MLMISKLPIGVGNEDCPVAMRNDELELQSLRVEELLESRLMTITLPRSSAVTAGWSSWYGSGNGARDVLANREREALEAITCLRRSPGFDLPATGMKPRQAERGVDRLASVLRGEADEAALELRLLTSTLSGTANSGRPDAHGELDRLATYGPRRRLAEELIFRVVETTIRSGLVEPLLDERASPPPRQPADEQPADRDTGLDQLRSKRRRRGRRSSSWAAS